MSDMIPGPAPRSSTRMPGRSTARNASSYVPVRTRSAINSPYTFRPYVGSGTLRRQRVFEERPPLFRNLAAQVVPQEHPGHASMVDAVDEPGARVDQRENRPYVAGR